MFLFLCFPLFSGGAEDGNQHKGRNGGKWEFKDSNTSAVCTKVCYVMKNAGKMLVRALQTEKD